jgi:hypothetical protein
MGFSDAVIARTRSCRVLVDAKACVKTSCTRAHAARLARPLAPLITRVCCFQASPVLTKKKEQNGWAELALRSHIRSIPSEVRGNGG